MGEFNDSRGGGGIMEWIMGAVHSLWGPNLGGQTSQHDNKSPPGIIHYVACSSFYPATEWLDFLPLLLSHVVQGHHVHGEVQPNLLSPWNCSNIVLTHNIIEPQVCLTPWNLFPQFLFTHKIDFLIRPSGSTLKVGYWLGWCWLINQ